MGWVKLGGEQEWQTSGQNYRSSFITTAIASCIGAGIGGAVGANAPTQKIVWGHCPHTLPNSSYKIYKTFT